MSDQTPSLSTSVEIKPEETQLRFERLPEFALDTPNTIIDFSSIFGLILALGFIFIAAFIGQTEANFFNLPSLLIVIFGTAAVTTISYTSEELARLLRAIPSIFKRSTRSLNQFSSQLINLSRHIRKYGILHIFQMRHTLKNDPFLHDNIQLAADGMLPDDIDRMLTHKIQSAYEDRQAASNILLRASEIAPAMGLIGTLVGLVQMLAQLEDPSSIGPAMAIALLTTFYGAILGTVILGPMAGKMERNAIEDIRIQTLVKASILSIARQENPRLLEVTLNSLLPSGMDLKYFNDSPL